MTLFINVESPNVELECTHEAEKIKYNAEQIKYIAEQIKYIAEHIKYIAEKIKCCGDVERCRTDRLRDYAIYYCAAPQSSPCYGKVLRGPQKTMKKPIVL